mmetsp:Transcript_1582/g.4602  ORF Transcript_1582/g.4602 Transcript_1582/m.4602 type:complete len:345 (+) Transcript_1582:190-1224(+)
MPSTTNTCTYCITGANGGLGLESVRQLALLHQPSSSSSSSSDSSSETNIFLLCRRESSANEAISALRSHLDQQKSASSNRKVNFTFVQFDSSDRTSVEAAVQTLSKQIPDGQHVDGLLCNAGGFTSDTKGTKCRSGATIIAETNLIGHAALVDGLLQSKKLADGKSRVIFSASEAGLGEPFAIKWGSDVEYYSTILDGSKYGKRYAPSNAYGHIKGIISFYCSALARRHPDIFFAAVTPGSTKGTNLIDQGSFSNCAINAVLKGFIKLSGQHSVFDGAKRYIDALVNRRSSGSDGEYEYPSGTFVTSQKKYVGATCAAAELSKGKAFGDEKKQDVAYEAVRKFL